MKATLAEARNALFAYLRPRGWTITTHDGDGRPLSVPFATNGMWELKLWLKPQSVCASGFESTFKKARVVCSDIRTLTPEQIVRGLLHMNFVRAKARDNRKRAEESTNRLRAQETLGAESLVFQTLERLKIVERELREATTRLDEKRQQVKRIAMMMGLPRDCGLNQIETEILTLVKKVGQNDQ